METYSLKKYGIPGPDSMIFKQTIQTCQLYAISCVYFRGITSIDMSTCFCDFKNVFNDFCAILSCFLQVYRRKIYVVVRRLYERNC